MDALHALDQLQAKPSDMFRGALSAIDDENNPDRIAQAAHSLREILYPIMSGRVRRSLGAREKPFEWYGSVFLEVGLGKIFGALTDLAHHGVTSDKLDFLNFTTSDFERLMRDFETTMQRALIRPIDLHRQIDEFLSAGPPQEFQ